MLKVVKISKQRIPVLIGKDGKVRKGIEDKTGTEINVIPDSTNVEIRGGQNEGFSKAKDIVAAIGRGFSPRAAFRLLDEECTLDMISLKNETGNTMKRLMARVIGRRGSVKRRIEKSTGARICVYGKTISFIGEYDENAAARELVEMLLEGRPHAKVFARMQEMKK